MDDKDVVSMTDQPNPLHRAMKRPPVPHGSTAVERKVEVDDSPLFTQLVQEVGHNPMDRNDPSWDEYTLANQMHAEARSALEKTATYPLHPTN